MSTGIVNGQNADASNFRGMIFPYAGSSAPSGFLLCNGQAVSRTTYSSLFTLIGTSYGAGDGSTTFNVPDLRGSVLLGLGQKTVTFDFVDGDVNTGNDQVTVDSNDFLHTGQAITLSTSGTLPTGLSAGTYYIIRVDATTIKFASSVANANAGVDVDITAAAGGGTHTITLTLTDRSLGDAGGEETHALTDAEMPSHKHGLGNETDPGSGSGFSTEIVDTSNTGDAPEIAYDTTWIDERGSDTPHNNMPPYVTVNYIIKT